MIEWCFVKRCCLFDPRHCFSTAPIWTEDRANFLSPNHTHPIKILSSAPFLTIPQRRWCDSLREEVMRQLSKIDLTAEILRIVNSPPDLGEFPLITSLYINLFFWWVNDIEPFTLIIIPCADHTQRKKWTNMFGAVCISNVIIREMRDMSR